MHTAISINAPVARQRSAQTLRWALLIALWLLALAWVRPLSDPDEGRYAVVALDMLRSGDWVTPTLNGLPFFHKPPLYYWLAAAGFSVLGVHEWVARLPSLIGAWMAAMSLLLLVRRYASAADAKAATVVLVTMPFAYLAAQYANMDMLLAGCVSACTACAFAATWNAGADGPALARLDGAGGPVCGAGLFGQGLDWHRAARHGVVPVAAVGATLALRLAGAVPAGLAGAVVGGGTMGDLGAAAAAAVFSLFLCHPAFSALHRHRL